MGFLRNTQDLLYLKKINCISAPEQNYFAHFAMRYPVLLWTLKYIEISQLGACRVSYSSAVHLDFPALCTVYTLFAQSSMHHCSIVHRAEIGLVAISMVQYMSPLLIHMKSYCYFAYYVQKIQIFFSFSFAFLWCNSHTKSDLFTSRCNFKSTN